MSCGRATACTFGWSVEWCFQELQLLWALARARRLAVAIGRPELAPRRHGVEGDGGREGCRPNEEGRREYREGQGDREEPAVLQGYSEEQGGRGRDGREDCSPREKDFGEEAMRHPDVGAYIGPR